MSLELIDDSEVWPDGSVDRESARLALDDDDAEPEPSEETVWFGECRLRCSSRSFAAPGRRSTKSSKSCCPHF